MNKKLVSLTFVATVGLMLMSSTLFAQFNPEFPPTMKAGPFPMGTEEVRNDSPVDKAVPADIIHEYTAYKGSPTIDGNVNEDVWNKIPWTLMEFNYDSKDNKEGSLFADGYKPSNISGWGDFTAWFKVLHDDLSIYVAVMRYDDEQSYADASIDDNSQIWQNDAYQMIIDSRIPGEYDIESPGAEVGFCTIGNDEAYNYWSTSFQNPSRALELDAGDCTSAYESTYGKAMRSTITLSDTGYVEIIEMSFVKWFEIFDNTASMFSIIALDRDNGVTEDVNQWGQGVYNKDNKKYGSIYWSTESIFKYLGVNDPMANSSGVLLKNYPNPFKGNTIITYQLNKNENVQIDVYSSSGQLVKTLINGTQSEGSHQISFDASGLNNGVYYCKLKTETYSTTSKMTLVND